MKFTLQGPVKDNINTLMRKIGYYFLGGSRETEFNLIRPLAGGDYPRFHLYIKLEGENWIFNLHLDQKRPTYRGTAAHAGEYSGPTVEAEAERIKQSLKYDQ